MTLQARRTEETASNLPNKLIQMDDRTGTEGEGENTNFTKGYEVYLGLPTWDTIHRKRRQSLF